jgi:hypothetical protein
MTDKNSSARRRKLLKTIAAGSGAVIAGKNLPDNWVRPVVDSVTLPAHAQTSTRTFFLINTITHMDNQLLDVTPEELIAQSEQGPLNWLVKTAEAQPPTQVFCIQVTGNDYTAQVQVFSNYYTGSGTVGDPLSALDSSCLMVQPLEFAVDDIVGSMANIRLSDGKKTLITTSVPEAPCNFMFECLGLDPN